MPSLRVGLIGCGAIAQQVHLPNLISLANVQVAALADPDDSHLSMAARAAPTARAFGNYEELLNEADVDAIVICVPNSLHAKTAIAALKNGVHVYLEKPLATNPAEANAVLEAWRGTGLVGMMGFNYRHNELYQSVRTHIATGALGKLLTVRTVFSTSGEHLPSWKLARRTGGGVLLDLASHHLDLIRYFFEHEVAEVSATVESRRSEQDTAWLQLRLADGLTIQSFFSTAAVEEDSFEIYGEHGKLTVDRYRSLNVRVSDSGLKGLRLNQMKESLRSLARAPYALTKMRAATHEPSYHTSLASFVEAIERNVNRHPDFNDGYQNLLIIDAAERSARTGSKVNLDLRRSGAMCA